MQGEVDVYKYFNTTRLYWLAISANLRWHLKSEKSPQISLDTMKTQLEDREKTVPSTIAFNADSVKK